MQPLTIMKSIYSFVLALLFPVLGLAQEADSASTTWMITNRPGNTEASRAVFRGGFQIETGFTFTRFDNDRYQKQLLLPSMGVLFGISNNMELRVFATNEGNSSDNSMYVYNVNAVVAGAKINLFKRRGALPEIALLIDQSIPTDFNADLKLWTTREIIAWSYSFGDHFGVSGNFIFNQNITTSDSETDFQFDFGYTLNLGYSVSQRFGMFYELYYFTVVSDRFAADMNLGLWYRITPKLQIDVYGGYSYSDPSYSINGGISWLILNH